MSDNETSGLLTDEQIVLAIEAYGIKYQRLMGGIAGAKDCWLTAWSQDARKLADAVRSTSAPLLAEIERERDARRAAQEQVEKLQAEVARLESMRQRADDIERLTGELEDAKLGQAGALDLVSRIRWAVGDYGARMQPELIEYLKQMRTDAERYRWLREQHEGDDGHSFCVFRPHQDEALEPVGCVPGELDAAIDGARENK